MADSKKKDLDNPEKQSQAVEEESKFETMKAGTYMVHVREIRDFMLIFNPQRSLLKRQEGFSILQRKSNTSFF